MRAKKRRSRRRKLIFSILNTTADIKYTATKLQKSQFSIRYEPQTIIAVTTTPLAIK